MKDAQGTFEETVSSSSERVQDLAVRLRHLINGVYPDAVEVPWPKQGTVGYGIGPKKQTEHFSYISLHEGHVNLGFNHGVDLPDPENLLEGTGKRHRHIKIREISDTERDALYDLVAAAVEERLAARENDQ